MSTKPSKNIKIFANPQPKRKYSIIMDCPEFTCLCPMTGQPDFAQFTIEYIPNQLCLELKSLKLYLWSYRNEGAFHEAVTNKILSDLVSACKPHWMEIKGVFNVRGGISTTVIVTHGKK
ncbi:MAG: preQ(1) synthase [Pseudomonadota bacterium]